MYNDRRKQQEKRLKHSPVSKKGCAWESVRGEIDTRYTRDSLGKEERGHRPTVPSDWRRVRAGQVVGRKGLSVVGGKAWPNVEPHSYRSVLKWGRAPTRLITPHSNHNARGHPLRVTVSSQGMYVPFYFRVIFYCSFISTFCMNFFFPPSGAPILYYWGRSLHCWKREIPNTFPIENCGENRQNKQKTILVSLSCIPT